MNKPGNQKKILVIEDENELRENIAEILSFENFSVFEASNGKQGIEMAREVIPDVILCDIMMPGNDGYEVLQTISYEEVLKNIPFIFITALDQRNQYRQGMEMGADDYLTKPFSRQELLNAIFSRLRKSTDLETYINKKINEIEKETSDTLKKEIEKKNNSISEISSKTDRLEKQVKEKEMELIKGTLRVIEVNNILQDLRNSLHDKLQNANLTQESKKILTELKNKTSDKKIIWNNWTIFQLKFNQVYPDFLTKLSQKFPGLTQYEMVFISAHFMGLNTSQISNLLNISDGSVRKSRYRLKKKLGLKKEDDYLSFIYTLNQ